jgi:ArsR family transcriptional regulator, virulence genes transcriptional regulator
MKMETKRQKIAANALESKAEQAADLLRAMANGKRLMALCSLLDGEKSAGALAEIVALSPAALSQHLAKLRALGLVAARRDGQTIRYSLAGIAVTRVLETLYVLYCAPERKRPRRARKPVARARTAQTSEPSKR